MMALGESLVVFCLGGEWIPWAKWIAMVIAIYLMWKIILGYLLWEDLFNRGSQQAQITSCREKEHSVRYLLCEDINWKVCEKVAKEATDTSNGKPLLEGFDRAKWHHICQEESDTFLQSAQSKWERETLLLEKMIYTLGSLQEVICGDVPERAAFRQEEEQTSVSQQPISFLDDATVAKLESHLTTKRTHHLMGLPSTILSSVRSFVPPAPPLAPQKYHYEVQVVPRLPTLSFLPVGTQKNLEGHLKKRIQFKHWKMPLRLQDVLICLKPPFPSKQETFQQGYKSRGVSENLQGMSRGSLSSPTEAVNTNITLQSQAKLQAHFLKKCLEVRLQSFPAIVQYSDKVMSEKGRNSHLPKLIPPGCVSLQPRNSSCLNLLEKADVVEMNIKCKLFHFRWNLPTAYTQSLGMFCPTALAMPILHSQMPDFSKCDHVEPTFLPRRDQKLLETHVLRKRLQHQWGMPGLVQHSLSKFLLPAPSSPIAQGAKLHGQQILTRINPLPFVSSETKQNLERHLKSIILQRQWGVPKRVFDSLQAFLPPSPQQNKRLPLMEEMKEKSTEKQRSCQSPAGYSRKTQGMAAQEDTQHLCVLQSETKILMQCCLVKKHLEILLEALPSAVRASWSCSFSYRREPLPKMILPGNKSLLPRRPLLPFACKEDVDRIEMTVKRNHLASLWELGTRYVGAIQMMPFKPLSQPFQLRQAISAYFNTPVKLLSDADRERLERHVLKKKIDHEWGLPILFQKSLQSFVGEPTSLSFKKMGKVSVDIQVRELSFLPKNIQTHLEHHIQKMKLHHLWELPRRVLQSTRMQHPDFKTGKPRPTSFLDQKSIAKKVGQLRPPAASTLKKGEVIPFHRSQRFPMVEAKSLDRIGLHLSKKSLEIHLEAFPRIFKLSWKCDSIAFKQPLPKLINPGVQPLSPRTVSFSLSPQEISMVDLSLRRSHMACLWGLGTRYVEVLGRIAHRLPFPLVKRAACEFSEMSTPFLAGTDREILERHTQKKRLQHLWGYPALVQESIQKFMSKTPTLSQLSKTVTEVQVLRQELSFLPQDITTHLESHIQKIKLQRRWAMPGRVLRSLDLFLPSPPVRRELPSTYKEKAEVSTNVAQQSYQRGVHTIFIAHKKKKDLDNHLERKCHQINFLAFPSPSIHSQEDVRSREWNLLPKLVQVGQKSPTSRNTSMFFLPPAVRDSVELNVKQKHLAFLWGLPQKHTLGHAKCSSIHVKQRNVQFQGQETLFLEKVCREQLEHHIKEKRLHHFWGMPSTIQNSLNRFIHPPPFGSLSPKGRSQEVRIQTQGLSFLPEQSQEKLETSLKKMIIRRQWGLPEKFHQSLRSFLPSLTVNKERHGEESMVESSLMYGPEVKRAKHIIGSQHRMHVDAPHKKSPDTSGKPFHKARSPKQSFPDGISFCICDQSSRGPVQSNVEASPHSATVSKSSQRRGLGEKDTNWQPVLLTPARQDVLPSPTESHQDETVCNEREIPKTKFLQRKMPIAHLTKEACEFMESHVRRKRLQHAWGMPQVVQKSLLAFAPPPPEPRAIEATMATHGTAEGLRGRRERRGTLYLPKSWLEEIISPHLLTLLSAEERNCLESHMRSWAVEHKWKLPGLVQDSLRTPDPSPLKDKSTQKDSHAYLSEHHHKHFYQQHFECEIQRHCDRKETPNEFAARKKSKEGPMMPNSQARSKMAAFVSPITKVPFLSDDSWNTLQLHILHKRVQHDWGLPSMVIKSLNAFAPFPPDLENRTAKGIAKPYSSGHWKLQTLPQNLSFLTSDTKESLEAHVRQMASKHRWEMPKRIQQSLKRFRAPRHLSQSRLEQAQPLLLPHILVTTQGSQTSPRTTRAEEYRTVFRPEGKGKLTFLPDESRENLESHVQHKKIHHLWGLPGAVLKSLHAFAPCPLDEEKDTLRTGETLMRRCQPEVHTTIGNLFFLDMNTKEHLEAHMRRRTAQHRWGLPKRVLHSVGVFLPPRPPPKLQLDQTQPLSPSQKKSFQETTFQPCSFLPLEVQLPFLTVEERSHLEFHIQRKKIQHGWSLPSAVIKSLRSFAPMPSKMLKETQGTRKGAKKPVENTAESRAMTGKLSFLSPKVKEHLDAHLKHMVTQHMWGLPQRVQKSIKAFLPLQSSSEDSRSHLIALLQPQLESSLKKFEAKRREALEEKKTLATTLSGRSTTTTSAHVMKSEKALPFLAEEDRHFLEFHIQHKKLQHSWGLPVAVQRSLRAFAPLSLSSAPGGIAEAERWQEKRAGLKKHWKVKEVDIAVQPLPFLSPTIKERLESHVKNLTVEHRWRLPKLVQESMRGFLPQVDEEGRHLVYNHLAREMSDASTQTETESISGSEDPRSYHSELFPEVIRDRDMSSWLVKEEPTFCPVTKCQHSQRIQERSWRDGREVGQRCTPDKKHALAFHSKKATPTMKSMVPHGAEPFSPFPSLSSPGMRRYSYNTSHQSEMPKGSQKRYPSVRSSLQSKGRKPHPCSSKGSFKKYKIHWQLESTFKTRAPDNHPPHRQKAPQSPGDSDTAWESVGSCKVSRCSCACHLSCSQSGSTSSVESTAEQRREKEEANTKANEPKGSSSYYLSKENEISILSSAKQNEEGSSSLPSEDNESRSSGSTAEVMEGFFSLPPGDNQPQNTGSADVVESSFSSLPSEPHEFHTSSTATKGQKGYSSLLSKDSESENSSSSSGKGQTDQETSQTLGEDMVQRYNTLVYQEAWDTSIMQSRHVVESNSSYEDIVARHYCQRPKGHKTKLSSKLQRKGSMPVWRTKSCHSLATIASESYMGLQAPSRAELLKVWPSESLTENGHSLGPPTVARVTEILDKYEDAQASEDTAREDPQDLQLNHQPSRSRSQTRDETDETEKMTISNTVGSAVKILVSGRKGERIVVEKAATIKEKVPRSGEIQFTCPWQEDSEPECDYDPEVDEEVVILSSILEKNLGLKAGYKAWKTTQGISNCSLKETDEDFHGDINVPSPLKGAKLLKLRAIEPESGDYTLATKWKEKIHSGTTEKGPQALCTGKEPSTKREYSSVFRGSRQGEQRRVEGSQPKKKEFQDHEQKSTIGKLFNTKPGKWLKMRIWRRKQAAGPPAEGAKE